MKEFKVRHTHAEARQILKDINAQFEKREVLEDLYLINTEHDIYKLARIGGVIKLVHLVTESDGFGIELDNSVDAPVQQILSRFFEDNPHIMRKEREHYKWRKSQIVLDNVVGLGEFIELYPANNSEKEELFTAFEIQGKDLITESYYSLWRKKKI